MKMRSMELSSAFMLKRLKAPSWRYICTMRFLMRFISGDNNIESVTKKCILRLQNKSKVKYKMQKSDFR